MKVRLTYELCEQTYIEEVRDELTIEGVQEEKDEVEDLQNQLREEDRHNGKTRPLSIEGDSQDDPLPMRRRMEGPTFAINLTNDEDDES